MGYENQNSPMIRVDNKELKQELKSDFNTLSTGINTDITQFKNQTTAQLADRATKEELDRKVSQIVSGSPKGTYSTLAMLQAAKPSGDAGVYVVSADGKWYYWNNAAWTAGGVYQSTGLGDKSVTSDKRTVIGDALLLSYFNTLGLVLDFDFDAGVVTIPRDTNVVYGKNKYGTSVTADLKVNMNKSFGLNLLYFNTVTNVFSIQTSGTLSSLSEDNLLIAVINLITKTVQCSSAYSINGREPGAKNRLPLTPRTPREIKTVWCGQDGTVVGDEIWMLGGGSSDHSVWSRVNRYDKNWGFLGALDHNLGHANGVDYKNGKLLVYNGGGYPPEISLYSNPKEKTVLNVSDSANTKIIFKEGNAKEQLEGDGSACFGESNNIVYYACIVSKVYLRIYKILLGMGDVNLSDTTSDKSNPNKWGTFISGKSTSDYNGTAQILGSYLGYVGSEAQPQGMCYDGYIYLSTGFVTLHALKIKLQTDGTFEVADDYNYPYTGYANNKYHVEPEATFILDDYLYVVGLKETDNMVKFRL
ncbi:hypothetical protein ANABIO32_13250 [Rossellomorea marisflavi]|nr:hypothetical protein ANABIO32_13250 [Rossellomorea marisflavi]